MENQLESATNDRVILQLPGMNTKWVRSNNQWVDMSKLPTRHVTHQQNWEEAQNAPRKWWRFWGKK